MYAVTNFKTKKALKEALAAKRASHPTPILPDDVIGLPCFQPGPWGPDVANGQHCCEGPHYPAAHKWYATVTVKNGLIVKAK